MKIREILEKISDINNFTLNKEGYLSEKLVRHHIKQGLQGQKLVSLTKKSRDLTCLANPAHVVSF